MEREPTKVEVVPDVENVEVAIVPDVAPEVEVNPIFELMATVPECIEFHEKYLRCIEEHAPPDTREAMLDAFENDRRSSGSGNQLPPPDTVAQACVLAFDAVKRDAKVKAWGCTW